MKPIRACDVKKDFVRYPIWMLPKIDGVRALTIRSEFIARSGKPFRNQKNSEFFSDDLFDGFDGEAVTDRVYGGLLCNETTSALNTIKGEVTVNWCLFDYILPGANNWEPYHKRYEALVKRVKKVLVEDPAVAQRLWVVPYIVVNSWEEVEAQHETWCKEGYEGSILRDPEGKYKLGTCTPREANYLRLKSFSDSEIEVTGVEQGQSNQNEQTKDTFGYAERSTHKENMVPNGMVGTITGVAVANVKHRGRILIKKGDQITVSPGKMSHDQRVYYWEHQEEIIGKIVKYKFFPHGMKSKPRFPTFQSFRNRNDL